MKRALAIATAVVAFAWLAYAIAGERLATFVAERTGDTIARLGQGKISSPADFAQHRIREAVWLATLLLLSLALFTALASWQRRRGTPRRWRWVAQSILIFICLNFLLSQAEKTVFFWGLMWQGNETQNLTRFYIKLLLARENPAPSRATLVGSSQTRAQIDEEILNRLLAPLLITTELHYPGSKAYDLYLIQPTISRARPDYVICYLTEDYFYGGSRSEVQPNFLQLSDLIDLKRHDGLRFISRTNLVAGALGNVFQIFRLREVLAQRLFGAEMGQLKQRQYNASLEADLTHRARRAAQSYNVDSESQFQQRVFEDFVIRCVASKQQVVLLVGQMNPLFSQAVDPRIRTEMLSFLHQLAKKYPTVTLVEDLPKQTPQDYEDLSHVTEPVQERFSNYLAEWLRQFLANRKSLQADS